MACFSSEVSSDEHPEATDVFVDMQGFRGLDNELVIKEMAILLDGKLHHLLFKEPFAKSLLQTKSKRTNHWLENNFHHLKWEDGFLPYEKMAEILCGILPNSKEKFFNIYVNGEEKQNWLVQSFDLQNYVHQIKDHFWYDFKKYKNRESLETPICTLNHPNCSVKNVYTMYECTKKF